MLNRLLDLRHDDIVEICAAFLDRVDLDPGHREQIRQLIGVRRQIDKFLAS